MNVDSRTHFVEVTEEFFVLVFTLIIVYTTGKYMTQCLASYIYRHMGQSCRGGGGDSKGGTPGYRSLENLSKCHKNMC